MKSIPLVRFHLSPRLHIEFGWTDLVRHAATRNPEVVGYLLEHPEILPPCDDPYTLFESWWPLDNLCVYIIRRRKGSSLAEWVITDGVFNQILPARRMIVRPGLVSEPQFEGLLGDVLSTARCAWTASNPGKPLPLLPGETGLPEAVILHRYKLSEAYIAPYAATMEVLMSKEPL